MGELRPTFERYFLKWLKVILIEGCLLYCSLRICRRSGGVSGLHRW